MACIFARFFLRHYLISSALRNGGYFVSCFLYSLFIFFLFCLRAGIETLGKRCMFLILLVMSQGLFCMNVLD